MSFRTIYGYSHSENGWRMCNRDECDIVRIPDLFLTETAPLRRGACLTILGAWLFWYDRNVEEIGSSVWGWSATNDVGNSNHLSGTAVDVNAPKYPWGARVMPADRIAKVREGLRLFEGTVFWGADWGRADEMHYQMNFGEGDGRNEAFAAKLRNGHLGIYGNTPKGDDMTPDQERTLNNVARQLGPWPQLGKNAKGEDLTLVDAVAYILHQLGPWPQLGTDDKGRPLTPVDALAALRADVDHLLESNK